MEIGNWKLTWKLLLDTPQPGKDVGRKHSDASTGGDSGEGSLTARFAVRKLISAYHNGNQTRDLGDRAGEQCL